MRLRPLLCLCVLAAWSCGPADGGHSGETYALGHNPDVPSSEAPLGTGGLQLGTGGTSVGAGGFAAGTGGRVGQGGQFGSGGSPIPASGGSTANGGNPGTPGSGGASAASGGSNNMGGAEPEDESSCSGGSHGDETQSNDCHEP